MIKERITLEVDAALLERLRASGVDPQVYIESLLSRGGISGESAAAKAEREAALRGEMKAGLDAYNRLIEQVGDWSDGLRAF